MIIVKKIFEKLILPWFIESPMYMTNIMKDFLVGNKPVQQLERHIDIVTKTR
jgi:hypothetical protein